MDIFMQALTNSLSDDMLGTLTQSLGADQATTEKAIGLALPLLLGSLERNAGSADGAQALSKALTRDHDGSILDDLVANLGRQDVQADGKAILGHVLGGKQVGAADSIGKATGLDSQQIMQLLALLAPIVLGALGKAQRKESLDAAGVASILTQNKQQATSATPGLTQLLDFDGDGDVTEEMVDLGTKLLGGLLSGKK
jgi:hypothetical protein